MDAHQLKNPFGGGLNAPQFNLSDIDGDGRADLLVFDRVGDVLLPFLNVEGDFEYAPSLRSQFPRLYSWVLFRDYDNDGDEDIFTTSSEFGVFGVEVHKNEGSNQFRKLESTIKMEIKRNFFILYKIYLLLK